MIVSYNEFINYCLRQSLLHLKFIITLSAQSANMSHYNSGTGFLNYVKMKNQKEQPFDSVQVMVNDPYRINERSFLTGGWDGFVRYYQIQQRNSNEEIQMIYSRFLEHPAIALTMGKNFIAFAGLATGEIVAVDMANDQVGAIGSHEAPICELFWIDNFNLLMSLGFDNKIKFWNLQNNGNFLAKEFELPYKTHAAAFDFPYLMVGTANGKMALMNLTQLPNLKIPDNNGWYDVMELGSKFTAAAISASLKIYVFGCVDGRCLIANFEDNYQGPKPIDSKLRMYTKSNRKDSSYSGSPMYGQVNDIEIGCYSNQEFIVLIGTEEISFFNLKKKQKPKFFRAKATAGTLSLDGQFFIYAEGNDWCEGMNDWKKLCKPKIQSIKFTKSELEALIIQ